SDAEPTRAGMPLEMPYSLDFPDTPQGIWLLHRDLLRGSSQLIAAIRAMGQPTPVAGALLDRIAQGDAAFLLKVQGFLGNAAPPPVLAIHALRLLPALAVARFGSSASPLDNYELGAADATGRHALLSAETLLVDEASGEITGVTTPPEIKFRDDAGLIRPVCPFFEVWAQFAVDGPLIPLTL